MQSVVIDRFEGEYAILFVVGSDEHLAVTTASLPAGIQEGDYLRLELADGQVLNAERDDQATEEARKRIEAKRNRLRRGDHLPKPDSE